jgi:hypothetical protein
MSDERIPTTERLARALEALGDPRPEVQTLIAEARAGKYDDFKTNLAFPLIELVQRLRFLNLHALAERVISGEFDAQKWEAEEWATTDEFKALMQELTKGK